MKNLLVLAGALALALMTAFVVARTKPAGATSDSPHLDRARPRTPACDANRARHSQTHTACSPASSPGHVAGLAQEATP